MKNKLAIVSLVLALLPLIAHLVIRSVLPSWPTSLGFIQDEVMKFAIFSFFYLAFFIAALVTGIISLKNIKTKDSDGKAITIISLVISILFVIAILIIFIFGIILAVSWPKNF